MTAIEERIRAYVWCGACGRELRDTGHLNFCVLYKVATWSRPVCGNLIAPLLPSQALAIVCDTCITKRAPAKWAIESLSDWRAVRYHPVEELDDMPICYPQPIVNIYGELVCPKCHRLLRAGTKAELSAGLLVCERCQSALQLSVQRAALANEIRSNYETLSGKE